MFTLAGLVGVVVTVFALGSRTYRRLAKTVDEAVSSDGKEDDGAEAPCLVPGRRRDPASSLSSQQHLVRRRRSRPQTTARQGTPMSRRS